MEIKQRGSVWGYKLLISFYKLFGYDFVTFLLNFVAGYYLFFTPSVKQFIRNYYEHQGMKFSNRVYFGHIKMFAHSILDRFIARIDPSKITFRLADPKSVDIFQEGAVAVLSHVGGWASAGYSLQGRLPLMHIVMKESTKKSISELEKSFARNNDKDVNIIDLGQSSIAVNVQIANALMNHEIVAMMADRVLNPARAIDVLFFGLHVRINKNPFEIAFRTKKTLVAIFIMQTKSQNYDLIFRKIESDTIEKMAQEYMLLLEKTVRQYPEQWYNFYDFFQN